MLPLVIICSVSLKAYAWGRPLLTKRSCFDASELAASQTESNICNCEHFEPPLSLKRQKRKIYEKPLLSKSRLRKRGKPGFWQWKLRMDPEAKKKNLKDAEEYIKAGYKLDPEAQAAAEAEVDAITPPSCGDVGNPQFARPRKKGRGPRKKSNDEYEEIDDSDPMFPRRSLTSGLFGNSKKPKKMEEVLKPGDTTLPRKSYLKAKCELSLPRAQQVSANKWTIRHSSVSLPPPAILSKIKSGFGFPKLKPKHANLPNNQRTFKEGAISSEENTPEEEATDPAYNDLILHEDDDDDDEYEKIPDDDEENGDKDESDEGENTDDSEDIDESAENGDSGYDSDGRYSEEGYLVHKTNAGLSTKNGNSKKGSINTKVNNTNRISSRKPKIGPKETKQDLVAKEERGSVSDYNWARRTSRTKTLVEPSDKTDSSRDEEVNDDVRLHVKAAINNEKKDINAVSSKRKKAKPWLDGKADFSTNTYSNREAENHGSESSKRRRKPITGIIENEVADVDRTKPKKPKTGFKELANLTASDRSDREAKNDGYDSSIKRERINGIVEKVDGADRAKQNKSKTQLNERADLAENDFSDREDEDYGFDSSSGKNPITEDAEKDDARLAAAEKLISGLDKNTARLVNGDSDTEEDEEDRGAGHRRRKPKKPLVRRGRIKTVLTYGARTQKGAKGTASLVCESGAWHVRTSDDMLDRFVRQWNGTEPAPGYIKVLVQSGKWYTYRADRLPVKLARFLARLPLEYVGRTETFTYKGGNWYVVEVSGTASRIILQGSLVGSDVIYAVTDTGIWYPVDRERMFKLALYLADLPIAEKSDLEPVARKARA